MKKRFKFLPIILLGFCLILNSCSREDVELKQELKVLESTFKYDFTENVQDNIEVRVVASSSHDITGFESFEDLEAFIIREEVTFKHEIFVENERWWYIEYNNGVQVANETVATRGGGAQACGRDADGSTSDSQACSSLGLNCCSWNTIDDWSIARRVWESFTGGVQEVIGECFLRNCAGW